MRKLASIVLIFAFLSTHTIIANAAVKPGSSCKKLGQTSAFSGKKYICVKSGKKLVWNKGITKLSPVPIDPNDQILFTALNEIRSHKSLSKSFQVNYNIENGVSHELVTTVTQTHINFIDSFGEYFDSKTVFNVVVSNTYNYVNSSFVSLGGTESWINSQMSFVRSAYPENYFVSRPVWAFATYLNNDKLKPILVYMSYPNYKYSFDSKEVGAHEMFHLVQESLNLGSGNLPCWIHEGQASFVGSALAEPSESFASTIRMIRTFGGMHSAGSDLSKIEAPQGWNGWHGSCMDVGEYQVGRIANAYLVGKYGWKKSLDFLKAMNGQPADGNSWKVVFENIFDQPIKEFYVDAELFINWFFKKYVS